MKPGDSRETIEELGFVRVGAWRLAPGGGSLDWDEIEGQQAALDAQNALYAFCEGAIVRYIGKTTRSIRRRFQGYRTPGATQATNRRCNERIRAVLKRDGTVDILVLPDLHQLQWSFLKVNLAAGLEDALIGHFDPEWNSSKGGKRLTETAEREATEDAPSTIDVAVSPSARPSPRAWFTIRLGRTYFNLGYINAGVSASKNLGEHNELASIYLGSLETLVTSRIDRAANLNGSVRFIGNNSAIADWFQANFEEGDEVTAEILDRHRILLLAKPSTAAAPSLASTGN